MLDISWTEFVLIGVIALIVIGPKELPAVMRSLGQWTRKIRSMAAEFQGQFQEAMREAEMADLKKHVDDIAHDIKDYDPLRDVREEVEAAGRNIQNSLEEKPALMSSAKAEAPPRPALPVAELGRQDVVVAATGPVAPEAAERAEAEVPVLEPGIGPPAGDTVAAATGPVVPEADAADVRPEKTGQGA